MSFDQHNDVLIGMVRFAGFISRLRTPVAVWDLVTVSS